MRALVITGTDRVEALDVALPEPGPGQARIRTRASAICSSDLSLIASWGRNGVPTIPGHEWSGVVEAVGLGGDETMIGRPCVAENVLSDGKEVGFDHPGAWGGYFCTEVAKLQFLPNEYPFPLAALVEPLAVAVHGCRRLRSQSQEPVLVLGDGPIGLLSVLVMAHEGHRNILLVGGRAERLALGRDYGATQVLDYHTVPSGLAPAIRDYAGIRFPAVVETTGTAAAVGVALELADRCGRIVLQGAYGQCHVDIPINDLHRREVELIGSNASAGAWPEAVRLAVEDRLPLHRLISRRLPADRFQEALDLARNRESRVIKVVLEWA